MQVLLKHMVKECPSLRNVYIASGCRLAKTWERHLQASIEMLKRPLLVHDKASAESLTPFQFP